MKRPVRTVLLVLAACVAAAGLALFLWLPWNPFEADAGPLDEWVPADVDAVVRFDAGALARADVVRTLWNGPAGTRLRDDYGLDERLGSVRDFDARLAALPFPGDDPPTVGRDLLGGEVLVALRGDDALVLARISGRAKAIDLIRRVGEERRRRWGVRIDGDSYVARVEGGREIRFARRRDVLLVSTSKDLLDRAVGLAAGSGMTSIVSADGFRDARPSKPSGATIGAWAKGALVKRFARELSAATPSLLPAFAHPIRIEVDARSARIVRVAAWFAGTSEGNVADLDAAARRLSVPGRTIAVGALPVAARRAVAALFDSQPPARRQLVDELLTESGSSAKAVTDDLAGGLADGVGFVVTRLPEVDALRLDSPDGDPVDPIPATIAVFHPAGTSAVFLAALKRNAKSLFGERAELREEAWPGGVRAFRPARVDFGPEWALLRPAVAIVGGDVVFTTNDDHLRSALAGMPVRVGDAEVASLRLDVPVLKKELLDGRWDAADRETRHDWAAERRAFRLESAARLASRSPEERRRIEDDEITARIRRRKAVEFPAALADYVASFAWLDPFGVLDSICVRDGRGLRLDATIEVRAR